MISKKIFITGLVQGVGFRPFVYNLAHKFGLKGFVKNTNSNLSILIQHTNTQKITDFIVELKHNSPQNAIIANIKIQKIKNIKIFSDFRILESEKDESKIYSAIPRDLALCSECEKELKSSQNRRFGYAFINCINCGPRWSIIENLPYDRERTAMKTFQMCESCEHEYNSIKNRRFHAQPNSCATCGIKMQLFDNKNNEITFTSQGAIFEFLRTQIKNDKIICFKGIGGFNLICAVNESTIKTLRERKSRPRKPFAIMFKDIKSVKKYFYISKHEENALLMSSAPIVLLSKPKVQFPQNLNYNLNTYGVIIAYSALHKLLFKGYSRPLIFTSANLSGESIITQKSVAQEKIIHIFDYLADYNRAIVNPIDDSLKRVLLSGKLIALRSGRGDYPLLRISNLKSNEVILALGANQKSQIAIFFSSYVLISRYIGDLDNIDNIQSFKHEILFLLNLYNLTPSVILCDCHRFYESGKIALELTQKFGARIRRIYHHRAHFYSNLFDNDLACRLQENILGVIFDGTGFGEDGKIWGGEFFMLDATQSIESNIKLHRIAHFSNFSLLGGESAIKDISKIALGILFSVYGRMIPFESKFKNIDLLYQMQQNGINSPKTSSVGRIFDFVAFMCGLESQSFEGESGGYIESLFSPKIRVHYDFEIKNGVILLEKIVRGIVDDYKVNSRKSRILIATKFINTLTKIITQIALENCKNYANLKVIFSGGVFANKILCDKITSEFRKHKIIHFFHSEIPSNDGGIAVGQIMAYLHGDYVE